MAFAILSKKLEKYKIISVLLEILAEVANVAASTRKMGVKVYWLDDTLGKISNKKKHLELLKKSKELTNELEELDGRRDESPKLLPGLTLSLCMTLVFFNVNNYLVKVLNVKK